MSGLTLIELLVAVAISGILVFAIAVVGRNTFNAMRGLEQRHNLIELRVLLRRLISCGATMAQPALATWPAEGTEIDLYNRAGNVFIRKLSSGPTVFAGSSVHAVTSAQPGQFTIKALITCETFAGGVCVGPGAPVGPTWVQVYPEVAFRCP